MNMRVSRLATENDGAPCNAFREGFRVAEYPLDYSAEANAEVEHEHPTSNW